MTYSFYIIDRYDNYTPIEDPVGWDGMSIVLKRDREKHGIFFDYQGNVFEYNGVAAKLLRAEYELYGIEGNMRLLVNYECGNGDNTLYLARFSFAQWEDEFGDDCGVRLPVETTSDIMTFTNRIDQKVDLQTGLAFDELTTLPAYGFLPFTQTMPGKSIFVQDYSTTPADVQEQYAGEYFVGPSSPPVANFGMRQVAFSVPGFTNQIAGEIGSYVHPPDTAPTIDVTMEGTGGSWTPPPVGFAELPYWINDSINTWDQVFPVDIIPPIINYDVSMGPIFGSLDVTLEGRYRKVFTPFDVLGVPVCELEVVGVYLGILKGGADPSFTSSWNWLSTGAGAWNVYPYNPRTALPLGADFTFSFPITLEPGDSVYYFDKVGYRKKHAYNTYDALFITNVNGSYFKVSGLSILPDTESKLFLPNEAFSRVAEAITDDQIRAVSTFYGRPDSEPYTTTFDGCGSLTAITQGLFIRQMEDKLPTRPPIFALSINDLWAGYSPIHNIGIGIEADPNRAGYNCLRIEEWDYFYAQEVIHSCIGVNKIKRKIQSADHVSIFRFGYDKWEAEEFNGIDEFLTKREYRTELTQARNTLSKLSQFIASGFAIEITRRKGNTTSEDWRYDKDTFVISMKRSGSDIIVQMGDINAPANIVDPATIYNFAIRPSIMAMRWLPYVLASYKQAGFSSKIIFTDGDGNVYAEGWRGAGLCRFEDITAISEKQDLMPTDTASPSGALPIWELEDITFEHPLTVEEFQNIKANPKGKIYYEGDGKSGYGWIDNIIYKPEAGFAEFSLIPERV